ncbi:MAG: triose-phosphate isomerase [Gammaproteobacteria bacterium]|nr:triose-phosphate isomerase [Gammaproteobacteria bacterium]
MRQYLVAGNWKMNGSTESVAGLIKGLLDEAASVKDVELAVFPPYPYLPQAAKALQSSSIAWGAQNLSCHSDGAYTGEVAANMLLDFNCRYVIVGHSERRQLYGEANAQVAAKFKQASEMGLTPILCVGESLTEREAGKTLAVVQEQLAVALGLHDNLPDFSQAVIAYEPVWAIGTGKTATPEEAQTVHAAIRAQLKAANADYAKMRILYGGSVKPSNANTLFAMTDIDGALVGGASLVADQFIEIARQCSKL